MKYTFQQRKFVFNKLIIALQTRLSEINRLNQQELVEHQRAEVENFFSNPIPAAMMKKAVKSVLEQNKTTSATWDKGAPSWYRRNIHPSVKITAPVTTPKAFVTQETKISSQLLRADISLKYPTGYATKTKKLIAEIEQLEEDMFLKDAPTLKVALEKLQAKVEAL